jgi:choline-sulfatase
MYEGSVGVPLIMSGPGVPRGAVCETAVSLVDLYPTLLDAANATASPDEPARPGKSLLAICNESSQARAVFSEFHGALSRSGLFMLREDRWKYVYSVGDPPQMYDLTADPHERHDLANSTNYAAIRQRLHQRLCALVDPDDVDQQAKANQRLRLEAAGGREHLLAEGFTLAYTPPPAAGSFST